MENRLAFIEQLVESIRRVDFVRQIGNRPLSAKRGDPNSDFFDPLKAAFLLQQSPDLEEACWLVFLATHFGKHKSKGWQLVRDVYSDSGYPWTWARVCSHPDSFSQWLRDNYARLTSGNSKGYFGNHRKYETLKSSPNGTGAVVSSYVDWVTTYTDHAGLFENALNIAEGDARRAFEHLYATMKVRRFGRTAKFDYLAMIGNLKLAPITPGSAHLINATGPLRGARLLYGGSTSANLGAGDLEARLISLDNDLKVGMQVLEDSLCNWQKSPGQFVRFRG